MDATLPELATLIMEVHEESRRREEARFSFCLVSVDAHTGHFKAKPLGICSRADALDHAKKRKDALKKVNENFSKQSATARCLADFDFVPGDCLDVAILFGHSLNSTPPMYSAHHQNYQVDSDHLQGHGHMHSVRGRAGRPVKIVRMAPPPTFHQPPPQ